MADLSRIGTFPIRVITPILTRCNTADVYTGGTRMADVDLGADICRAEVFMADLHIHIEEHSAYVARVCPNRDFPYTDQIGTFPIRDLTPILTRCSTADVYTDGTRMAAVDLEADICRAEVFMAR